MSGQGAFVVPGDSPGGVELAPVRLAVSRRDEPADCAVLRVGRVGS